MIVTCAVVGRRVSYEGTVRLRFHPTQQSATGDRRSLQQGWLKLGLRLSLPEVPQRPAKEYCPFGTSRIAVEVLTDEHLRKHVAEESSIDVLGVPRNTVYHCLPHQLLKDVEHMVLSIQLRAMGRMRVCRCIGMRSWIRLSRRSGFSAPRGMASSRRQCVWIHWSDSISVSASLTCRRIRTVRRLLLSTIGTTVVEKYPDVLRVPFSCSVCS